MRRDATLWCWGPDYAGQLANGIHTETQWTPSPVLGLAGIVDFSAGAMTCAITQDRQLWSWGQSLGADGTNQNRDAPAPVMPSVVAVVADLAACAVDTAGQAWCWADQEVSLALRPIAGLTDVQKVTLGFVHRCALRAQGDVVCWGWAASTDPPAAGLFGDGGKSAGTQTPVPVLGLTDAVDVSAGSVHTCALRRGGDVVCWGDNTHGQLGDGTTTSADVPVNVIGLE
jgi:alpha-tubulin suppressor-like RCC1 family protein